MLLLLLRGEAVHHWERRLSVAADDLNLLLLLLLWLWLGLLLRWLGKVVHHLWLGRITPIRIIDHRFCL